MQAKQTDESASIVSRKYRQSSNDDENDAITVPEIVKKSLKRKPGQEEIFDEIIVERLD